MVPLALDGDHECPEVGATIAVEQDISVSVSTGNAVLAFEIVRAGVVAPVGAVIGPGSKFEHAQNARKLRLFCDV